MKGASHLLLAGTFVLIAAGCGSDNIPVAADGSESSGTVVSAKPTCPGHPSCGDDGGGDSQSASVTFSDGVVGSGTMSYSNDGATLTVSKGDFETALNLDATQADAYADLEEFPEAKYENTLNDGFDNAGDEVCVSGGAGAFQPDHDVLSGLIAMLTDPSQARVTGVNVDLTALDAEDPDHLISFRFDDPSLIGPIDLTIGQDPLSGVGELTGSATVSYAESTSTYTFTGGYLWAQDRNGKGKNAVRQIHCHNVDAVSVVIEPNE